MRIRQSRTLRPGWTAATFVALAAVAVGGCSLGDEDSRPPQLGPPSDGDEAAAQLGFPSTATRNTVRVGGDDAAGDAAGVANAAFPATTAARATSVAEVRRFTRTEGETNQRFALARRVVRDYWLTSQSILG